MISVPFLSDWTHVVVNLIGLNNIRVHFNGNIFEVTNIISSGSVRGPGRIIIGKPTSNRDQRYASVDVDELRFFNKHLPNEQITMLGQLPN